MSHKSHEIIMKAIKTPTKITKTPPCIPVCVTLLIAYSDYTSTAINISRAFRCAAVPFHYLKKKKDAYSIEHKFFGAIIYQRFLRDRAKIFLSPRSSADRVVFQRMNSTSVVCVGPRDRSATKLRINGKCFLY